MEKEITTTNQTTALADSLIVVQQLPIIKEQLKSFVNEKIDEIQKHMDSVGIENEEVSDNG